MAARVRELFPAPGEPDFLRRLATDARFAVHRQPPRRRPARNAAEFAAASAEACGSRDELSRSFELSMQQAFLQLYLGHLSPYRSLLLFHMPGAGKTCTAITIALDHLRHMRGSGAGRVLVVASEVLQANFRTQVFDDALLLAKGALGGQCTRDTYLRMVAGADRLGPEELRKRVGKLVTAHFATIGPDQLATALEALPDEEVTRRYSDKIIIVDEAHNMRPSHGSSKRASVQMARLARLGRRNRLVLLTATPMYNSDAEIAYLLNLCLENDGRPPLPPHAVDDPAALGAASAGYVSYSMAADPVVFPARFVAGTLSSYGGLDFYGRRMRGGRRRFPPGLAVVPCPMQREQRAAYDVVQSAAGAGAAADDERDDAERDADEEPPRSVMLAVRVSNVAFPAGSAKEPKKLHGKAGFTASFVGTPWSGNLRYAPGAASAGGGFLSPHALPRWSAKLARLADNLDAVREGPVLCYSEYIESGVLSLAIALEHRGWTRRGGPALLAPDAAGARPRADRRYMLLTGDYRYTPDLADAVRAINAGEAAPDGEVLAVLITRVASEGVNFKGVREVHVLEPWYNAAKIEQVVGRAVRTCQHAHLPPERRNVTVYYYAATLGGGGGGGGGGESSDLHMYAMSSDKAERIAAVEAQLRANAIDCALFADAARTVDPALRLRMVELADAAVRLELQALGGRALLRGRDGGFQRRLREAAFLVVVTPTQVQLKTDLART